MFRRYGPIITVFLFAACTKASQPLGSCIQSGGPVGPSLPELEGKLVDLKARSFGGFIDVTQTGSGGAGHRCTAFVETGITYGNYTNGGKDSRSVATKKNGLNMIPVTIWTAKHCLKAAKLSAMLFKLSVETVDGSKSGYLDLAISLDSAERFRSLAKGLDAAGASGVFESFAKAYEKYDLRDFEASRKQILASQGGPSDAEFDEFDDIGSFEMGTLADRSDELAKEKMAFGSPMCNDFSRAMTSKSNQKVCITYEDLGGFTGYLELDEGGIVASMLKQQAALQAKFTQEFQTGEKYKSWIDKADEDLRENNIAADMAGSWKQDIVEQTYLTTQLAYAEVCGNNKCGQTAVFSKAFTNFRIDKDIIAEADSEGMAGLLGSLEWELVSLAGIWNQLTVQFFSISPGDIQIHTNFNFGGGVSAGGAKPYYDTIPFSSTANGAASPLMWRTYGLIYWGDTGSMKFFKKDSGTMISLGGVFPIAMVSSVNNKPTSGGVANSTLPTLQASTTTVSSEGDINSGNAGDIAQSGSQSGGNPQPIVYQDGTQSGISGSTDAYDDGTGDIRTTSPDGSPVSGGGERKSGVGGGGQFDPTEGGGSSSGCT